jgi:hypothetical protein
MPTGVIPCGSSLDLISGDFAAAANQSSSWDSASFGALAGANSPYHRSAS